jgi:hypothetical protein
MEKGEKILSTALRVCGGGKYHEALAIDARGAASSSERHTLRNIKNSMTKPNQLLLRLSTSPHRALWGIHPLNHNSLA